MSQGTMAFLKGYRTVWRYHGATEGSGGTMGLLRDTGHYKGTMELLKSY